VWLFSSSPFPQLLIFSGEISSVCAWGVLSFFFRLIAHYLFTYLTILAFSTVRVFCLVRLVRPSLNKKMEFLYLSLFLFLFLPLVPFGSLLFPAYYLRKVPAGLESVMSWVGIGWLVEEGMV